MSQTLQVALRGKPRDVSQTAYPEKMLPVRMQRGEGIGPLVLLLLVGGLVSGTGEFAIERSVCYHF